MIGRPVAIVYEVVRAVGTISPCAVTTTIIPLIKSASIGLINHLAEKHTAHVLFVLSIL